MLMGINSEKDRLLGGKAPTNRLQGGQNRIIIAAPHVNLDPKFDQVFFQRGPRSSQIQGMACGRHTNMYQPDTMPANQSTRHAGRQAVRQIIHAERKQGEAMTST